MDITITFEHKRVSNMFVYGTWCNWDEAKAISMRYIKPAGKYSAKVHLKPGKYLYAFLYPENGQNKVVFDETQRVETTPAGNTFNTITVRHHPTPNNKNTHKEPHARSNKVPAAKPTPISSEGRQLLTEFAPSASSVGEGCRAVQKLIPLAFNPKEGQPDYPSAVDDRFTLVMVDSSAMGLVLKGEPDECIVYKKLADDCADITLEEQKDLADDISEFVEDALGVPTTFAISDQFLGAVVTNKRTGAELLKIYWVRATGERACLNRVMTQLAEVPKLEAAVRVFLVLAIRALPTVRLHLLEALALAVAANASLIDNLVVNSSAVLSFPDELLELDTADMLHRMMSTLSQCLRRLYGVFTFRAPAAARIAKIGIEVRTTPGAHAKPILCLNFAQCCKLAKVMRDVGMPSITVGDQKRS
ncbi:hypothetical protein J8273_4934 [Carpediemonas membranifera]|uniref:AMP-activated protein kinase glycogen-binding domain-containing protein n=1 Tax=Carpediemonas membranifera TaxID=201153 RepID=A0A8J6B3P5_9EUKA|nr:hypothetical protein J8273_4934 [Carpediemonas membranifera]|eukprot:KAG9393634.1 hypothetical protein J8273_4934 [Carpediemonas membranifera]